MHYEQLLKGHPAENIARLCFSKLRFLPAALKAQLRQQGLWEDLAQELYRIALEGWIRGMSPKEVGGIASGEIRAFLRAYGYRRYRDSFFRSDESLPAVCAEKGEPWVMARAEPVPSAHAGRDGLEEAILALLRQHPEGLSKCQVKQAFRSQAPAVLILYHCDRLVVRGVLREIARPKGNGRPPGPILVLAEATTCELAAAGR